MKEEFKVIFPFRDLEDTNKTYPTGRKYAKGDLYPAVFLDLAEERIDELTSDRNKLNRPLIERIEEVEVGED